MPDVITDADFRRKVRGKYDVENIIIFSNYFFNFFIIFLSYNFYLLYIYFDIELYELILFFEILLIFVNKNLNFDLNSY